MNEIPKGRMAAGQGVAPARKGRGKGGLEIEFDPLADGALDVAEALGTAADPFAPAPFLAQEDVSSEIEEEPEPATVRRAPRQPEPAASREGSGERLVEAGTESELRKDTTPPDEEPLILLDRKARQRAADSAAERLGLSPTLARIEVTVTVEIGRTRMTLSEIASVTPGELVALDRMTEEPVDVLVNGRLFARGEVVALGTAFGVRLLELAGEAP